MCLGSPLRTCECAAVDAPSQKSPKMENIRYEVVNDVNDSNETQPLTSTIFRSVVSPELGCSFVVGDFILFGSHEDVGQIDIIMDDMTLKVNCWLRFLRKPIATRRTVKLWSHRPKYSFQSS